MSWTPALASGCPDAVDADAIETFIIPRTRDLGGFEVRRALPTPMRQMVGSFIFLDQPEPAEFLTWQGVDVHPHIGLGTVTCLYRGDFHYRDSLGIDQIIRPGMLNRMVAGRGVNHSELTSAEGRSGPHSLNGIQTWVALPEDHEDMAPIFKHRGKDDLPVIEGEGVKALLILGNAFVKRPRATLYSETFCADVDLAPGARFPMPDEHEDRAICVTDGSITIAGRCFDAVRMMVFRPGDRIAVAAGESRARLMILGVATLNGPRYIWWNFVASSKERIEEAKRQWRAENLAAGLFDLPNGDRAEHVLLPD